MPEFLFTNDKNPKPTTIWWINFKNLILLAETYKPFLFCVLCALKSLAKADHFQKLLQAI